jgi:hypothetical protein
VATGDRIDLNLGEESSREGHDMIVLDATGFGVM